MTKEDDERAIRKPLKVGSSIAITLPKTRQYEPFRKAPFLSVQIVIINGKRVIQLEIVPLDKLFPPRTLTNDKEGIHI